MKNEEVLNLLSDWNTYHNSLTPSDKLSIADLVTGWHTATIKEILHRIERAADNHQEYEAYYAMNEEIQAIKSDYLGTPDCSDRCAIQDRFDEMMGNPLEKLDELTPTQVTDTNE